jgi:DNA-binding transcriptional MerR regulator
MSRLGLLTPAETAEQLGVSTHTLARWRRQGRGPAWRRLSRGTIRYFCASMLRHQQQGGEGR